MVQGHLPFAALEVNRAQPPLAYEDSTFGLCYAFSVFTHLPEELQSIWLAELSRVLRPGGYLLMTIQGKAYADMYLSPEEQDKFRCDELVVLEQGSPGENSYNAYHPTEYVRSHLLGGFELLKFEPGKVIDRDLRIVAQDTYLLKKS